MIRATICAITWCACVAANAAVSPVSAGQEFTLPADPSQWINTPPLTKELLAGKGVFLWFYEEQCPNCRKKWPGMMALAKAYEDKPVVFIAVNSGNPRSAVEQYAREVNLNWPVIVDPSRDLEKAAGLDMISLENIHQAMYLTADGKLKNGNWSNVEQTVQQALAGAQWRIDPASIPAALRPAWRSLEFGNYTVAAPLVKKGVGAANPELKQAATKLNEYVQGKIQADVESANRDIAAGNKWPAYRTLDNMARQFAGFDLPKELPNQKKELAADEQVKQQLVAMRQLESIKRGANTATPAARKRIAAQLERLIKSSPGSTAAEEAAELLKQFQ